ncbi:MAG: archease [Candidatus Micrarchaeota archaeon]|nr:archease [Candidatus Micrarchaeota archaeon]
MKKGFRYIEHTADIEFIASGKSLEDTFRNALLALFDTQSDTKKLSKSKGKKKVFTIRDEAPKLEELLWRALQDTLSLTDSEARFGYDASGLKITEKKNGYAFNCRVTTKPQSVELSKLDVKGIAKYDLKVEKKRDGYSASVVLDV